MPLTNHQVRLAARPNGLPRATDWSLTTEEVPEPAEGQFVVAVSHLSVDPAMRGWMNAGASYVPPVEIGAVMRAGAVGRVAASAIAAASPTPGGLGAIEAALVAGLTGVGLGSGAAVSAVLTYRLATYWLPVAPGWIALNLLQRHDYV